MIFRLQIDRTREEEVVVTAHKRTPLIDEIENLVMREEIAGRVAGYEEDDIVMLDPTQVECFYSESDRTWAVCDDGKRYLIKKRLYELEAVLPEPFERISKSAIANRDKIRKFKVQLSGAVDVVFQSGYTDCVSRRCFAELKRRYGL